MKSLLKSVLFGSTALGMLATSFSALAMPPHYPDAYDYGNVWWLMAYDDDSNAHNWVENRVICFDPWNPLDMHAEYSYWRDVWSYPNFSPFDILFSEEKARQEGDQIFMVGDGYYCNPTGTADCRYHDWHDSRQWEMTSLIKGHGHLQRWNENNSGEKVWANIELERIPLQDAKECDCKGLTSYFSSVDINIDNAETLGNILSTRPECGGGVITDTESAPSGSEIAR